jgi:hypothetical protein
VNLSGCRRELVAESLDQATVQIAHDDPLPSREHVDDFFSGPHTKPVGFPDDGEKLGGGKLVVSVFSKIYAV